jgi:hypothetical protein
MLYFIGREKNSLDEAQLLNNLALVHFDRNEYERAR